MEPTSHLAEKYARQQALQIEAKTRNKISISPRAVEQSGTQNLSMSFHDFYKTEQQQQTNRQTNRMKLPPGCNALLVPVVWIPFAFIIV